MSEVELKELRKDIEKTKAKLIRRVKEKGMYEYFGHKELRALERKYKYDYSEEGREILYELVEFKKWCDNYRG